MPTLEVIRRIEIQGKTTGLDEAKNALDRLNSSIQAANDNLNKANASARASGDGWGITSQGALSAANHLRQAAEAAYVFSPAFRSVVNEMRAPVLAAAGAALTTVAAGIVTATNYAGTGLVSLALAAEKVTPNFMILKGGLLSAGLAMEAFAPAASKAAGSILAMVGTVATRFLPIVGQIILVYDAIKMVGLAWQLGGEKLAEYVSISDKASRLGVSADFFQRMGKAAEEAKTPIDQLTKSFEKLNDAASPELGGNTAQKRLQSLLDAGNFKGNSGIADLKAANSTQESFDAIVKTVHEAMDAGQRLAAIDLTKSFMGPEVAANLAKDSEYLDKMKQSIDEAKAKDLIPDSAINNAVELQNRLDAAEKILSQRWHPIQELLTQLGIKMREVWVDIVEAIAKAVDAVFRFGQLIGNALSPLFSFLQMAGQLIGKAAPYLAAAPAGVGLPLAAGAFTIGKLSEGGNVVTDDAKSRLASGLRNPNAIAAARDYANSVYDAVHRDTSHDPNAVKPLEDAWKRATAAVEKYIQTTQAETETVGKSVAEQEKAKVVAQLTAAAMKDGLSVSAAKAKAEMSGLGDSAAAAALALEKAKIGADIKFNRNTALLSQEDVQIATELKGLYANVATALGSVEAAAMRANGTLKPINDNQPPVKQGNRIQSEGFWRRGCQEKGDDRNQCSSAA